MTATTMTTIRPIVRRALLLPALALLVPAVLTACGDDDDANTGDEDSTSDETVSGDATEPASTGAPGDAEAAAVDIISVPDGFGPATITVAIGAEVTWTNTDGGPHTTTAENGAWDSGNLGQGESFSFTPSEAGTFAYFCAIHPSMVGELIVE